MGALMTNLRFAILAASLSVACVRDIDLAKDDGPDGGPPSDAPVTGDAPALDLPSVDAPSNDVPSSPDAPTFPYCPQDVDRNTAQNPALLYPRAVVTVPPDSTQAFPAGPSYSVSGLWVGPRRLSTPVDRMCPASVASAPACHPDAVIRVQPVGATAPVEFLVSVPFDELPVIAVGTLVTLTLDSNARAQGEQGFTLRLTRAGATEILIVNGATATGEVSRVDAPTCVSRPEPMCRRTLGAFALRVEGATSPVEVSVMETRVFTSASGSYRARNYGWSHRVPSGGAECADITADSVSYEIVRVASP